MIPQAYIAEWRKYAPWSESHQVEQDLVLTKALIQIYSDKYLKEAFAFRGGTAMQKIYFESPTRYSEDIDLVQIRKETIGASIDVIRGLEMRFWITCVATQLDGSYLKYLKMILQKY